MSATDNVLELPHCFEIYFPSQCRCGKPLPAAEREDIFTEAKSKMVAWCGGANVRVEKRGGLYPLKSGEMAEEPNDVICGFATEEAFREHREDLIAYTANLANRLTQESMLCRVDDGTFIYPSDPDPTPHRCAQGAAPLTIPGPLPPDAVARAKVLQTSLQRIASLQDARDLFCNILHYSYCNSYLPTREWPDDVKLLLTNGAAPHIIADQNGFKVVYLQMAEETLRKAHERQIVLHILKDQPDLRGLVVVSDVTRKQWHLVNVKSTASVGAKQSSVVLRRMRVGSGQSVRTAVERLLLTDVEEIGEDATAAQLQEAHDRAFDAEAVSKQFYNDLANWYFWALKNSKFPKDAPKEADGHDHIGLIRLITRLIFCWFLREKGLIPDALFDRRKLQEILVGFTPDAISNKDSVYYRAILQNLFFATLNTEMDKRDWVKEDQNFMAHSLYRFKEAFNKPGTAMGLFKTIPFLNGGLFECLDKDLGQDAKPRYVHIDGFSRRSEIQPTIPDFLFFAPDTTVDLSEDYGDKKFKRVNVRGLIATLRHYNFTIEENTPIEQEVALDPELCGKVFENLLAAYNPETGSTARKQTGSFYTPREVVNYMVDEALVASLKTKMETAIPLATDVEHRLRCLFSYDEETNPFSLPETDALIAAVDSLKTLDPAVGSGAFPMGLLQKLVFVLKKLDPDNAQWRTRQQRRAVEETEAAFRLGDKEERDRRLKDINDVFDQNASDYGRKLYLIENCIYGVDIQPIAVQIAKMRFFISLVVDQTPNPLLQNLGVRPLPNLETKFVAANSLVGVERNEKQGDLLTEDTKALRSLKDLRHELARIRHQHFLAKTPATKDKCRRLDRELREKMSHLLKQAGVSAAQSRQMAGWDPYNQSASASFFDPEWMFGVTAGYDISIGNPPYVRQEEIKDLKIRYKEQFECFSGTADLFVYFYERSFQILKIGGVVSFISSNKFFRSGYGERLRWFLTYCGKISLVLDFGDAPIFAALAYPTIIVVQKTRHLEKGQLPDPKKIHSSHIPQGENTVTAYTWDPSADVVGFPIVFRNKAFRLQQRDLKPDGWRLALPQVLRLIDKMRSSGTPLGDYVQDRWYWGIKTGLNEAFVVDRATCDRLIAADKSSEVILLPFLRGRDVKRWNVEFAGQYLIRLESSENKLHAWSNSSDREAEKIFAKTYPAIHAHLTTFRVALNAREDQGKYFWELRSCAYWGEFAQSKIIVPSISGTVNVAVDNGCYLSNNKSSIFVLPDPAHVAAIVNSRASLWFTRQVFATKQGGFFDFEPRYSAQWPIPPTQQAERTALGELVESIQKIKRTNRIADVSDYEREIDDRVYRLYGLSKDEIKIVEESSSKA